MEKINRVDNPILREYLYKIIPQKINENELFKKIYGENFASKMIKRNVLTVYSNEPYSINEVSAYHNGVQKAITFCCARKDTQKLLTPDEIVNDKKLQETAMHECIHAILERTEEECKAYNIVSGTGLLERYVYLNAKSNELGRGLNEGFTEWLCEKLGFTPLAYIELTNFVRLIESAIGTEKTMMLGKGGIRARFPSIFNMNSYDVDYLLALSDQVYSINYHLTIQRNLENILSRYINIDSYDDEIKKDIKREYEENSEVIQKYFINHDFIYYASSNQLQITEETLLKFLKEKSIPKLEKQKTEEILYFESFILDKFFIKDLQLIFESEEISDENFEKISKINSFLNTNLSDVAEEIKNRKAKPSVIVFKEKFKIIAERYVKLLAIREAQKYEKGELGLVQLTEMYKKMLLKIGLGSQIDIFLKELSKQISFSSKGDESFSNEVEKVLQNVCFFGDSKDYLKKMANASIYKLKPKDSNKKLNVVLLYDKENFLDKYYAKGDIFHEVNEDYQFDFTEGNMKNEYEVAMQNFLKLQREVFNKNPNATIHITSREVIVQDGEKLDFYEIDNGELVPMVVDQKLDFKFQYDEKEKKQTETSLEPIKIGIWKKIINLIKRKINDFKTKDKTDVPNYVEDSQVGNITFDIPKKSNINRYRLENYNERLAKSRESRENNKNHENIETEEER